MEKPRALLSWSSGKDSAFALHALRSAGEVDVVGLLPLWERDTHTLARSMIAAGTRAVLTCVDPAQLDPRHAGRSYDSGLLSELPPGCDPCGERGEFHTFAWDGPSFSHAVPVTVGEIVQRDGFVFADLLPARMA
jgi:diphthamide synthase (EF-2-diphthine--ammonia ligase)